MNEQKEALEQAVYQWQHCDSNCYEQTDDITVKGIKFFFNYVRYLRIFFFQSALSY